LLRHLLHDQRRRTAAIGPNHVGPSIGKEHCSAGQEGGNLLTVAHHAIKNVSIWSVAPLVRCQVCVYHPTKSCEVLLAQAQSVLVTKHIRYVRGVRDRFPRDFSLPGG